jgi:hydantoinase/carbamoylase family amidase
MLETLGALRRCSSTSVGTTRIAFSPEFEAARDLVLAPFAGDPAFQIRFDAVDNAFVRYGPGLPAGTPLGLLVGSHLDSVRSGGPLDGPLGVVAGAALLRGLRDARAPLAAPVGLAIFADEEGARFGNGTFGSRALAGRLAPGELDLVEAASGRRLRDYVAALAARPRPGFAAGPPEAVRLPWPARAFVEPHIEQGPRLERAGVRVGVVTAIVGIRRVRVVCEGEANHAGTTAMADRVDALVPVARIAAALPSLVEDLDPAVITAGEVRVEPNALNVIPGRAALGVEFRAPGDSALDLIASRLTALVEATGKTTPARLTVEGLRRSEPAVMDPGVRAAIRRAADALGEPAVDLVSLAGHDAMNLARLCPTGMFFVPSLGGLSHCPREASRDTDVELALDLLLATAAELGVVPREAVVRSAGRR